MVLSDAGGDNCRDGAFVTMEYRSPPRNTDSMANKPPFAQGAQVEHPKFGLGSVLSCNEDYIVIKFDDHGEKKFVTTLVMGSLKKSDRAAPVEKKGTRKKKTVVPATV